MVPEQGSGGSEVKGSSKVAEVRGALAQVRCKVEAMVPQQGFGVSA